MKEVMYDIERFVGCGTAHGLVTNNQHFSGGEATIGL